MDSRLDHLWTDSDAQRESSCAVEETVRAPIARGRVGEMLARGWRLAGPSEESVVWMEGPTPDGRPQPLANPVAALMARAWDRAATADSERPYSVAA